MTFVHAAVNEVGFVAGAGCSEGSARGGLLRLMVLDTQGDPVVDVSYPRTLGPALHDGYGPGVLGVVLDEDFAAFRVSGFDCEPGRYWEIYSLATGGRLPDRVPRPPLDEENPNPKRYSLLEARAIPGTSLILENWWVWSRSDEAGQRRHGGVFVLVDAQENVLWRHARLEDYRDPSGEVSGYEFERRVREHGAILDVDAQGGFSLWHVADDERARFRVERTADGGVRVEQVGSEPFRPAPFAARPQPVSLERLEPVALRLPSLPATSAVRNVVAFGFADAGSVEFVRREGEDDDCFVRLSLEGEVLFETPLPSHGRSDATAHWYDRGGDEWWRVVQGHGPGTAASLSVVDVRTGSVRALEDYSGEWIEAFATTPGGGFVALGERRAGQTQLVSCDAEGRETWRVSEGNGALLAPSDVTVTPTGRIVTIDPIRDALALWTPEGEPSGTIDLALAFGEEAHYPCEVLADAGGGVFVRDRTKLWHVGLNGELLGVREPKDKHGLAMPMVLLAVDASGSAWSSDRTVIGSIASDGKLERIAGHLPSAERLEVPWSGWIDAHGRILIQDRRTRSVHVFRSDGEYEACCVLAPWDHPRSLVLSAGVSADAEGRIYVPGADRHHVVFEADGRRIGSVDLGARDARLRPMAPDVRARTQNQTLRRAEPGAPDDEITHTPGGRWFEWIQDFGYSSDGSTLAVLDGKWGWEGTAQRLAVFEGDGTPRLEVPIRQDTEYFRVATSADWGVVFVSDLEVLLVRYADGALLRPSHLPEDAAEWTWGFSPAGDELWGLEHESLVLQCFALP